MKTPVWKTLHIDIDGVLNDREDREPGLSLTMRPMGIMLERKDQVRELEIRIDNGVENHDADWATLDEDGIAQLAAFLRLKP